MTVEQDLFRENTAAYVLGELRGAERTAFEAHLDGCEGCAAEVRAMAGVLGALPHGVPLVEPPGGLRQRVLDAAIAAREPSHVIPFAPKTGSAEPRQGTARGAAMAGWLAAAASLAVAVGLGVHSMNLQGRLTLAEDRLVSVEAQLQDSQERLQVSQRETLSTRASLAVLSAPDARDLRLAGQAPAPGARARAFLSRSRGVLFAATNLPSIPNDRTYQLWYLTPGAPVSAGLLRPDADGSATVSFALPPSTAEPTGLAVSIEPEGGVPAPTGAIYLVTQ